MNILFRVGRGGSSANSAGSTVRWTARAVCVVHYEPAKTLYLTTKLTLSCGYRIQNLRS